MKKLVIVAACVAFVQLLGLGLVAACVVSTEHGFHLGFGPSETASRQETHPLELSSGKLLDVAVRHGSIRVTASTAGAPSLSAKLTASAGTQEKANQALADAKIDIQETGDGLRIRVLSEEHRETSFLGTVSSGGIEADLDLLVPAGVRLDLRSESGDVEGEGAFASSKVHSSYGSVKIRGVDGELEATSSSGDVTVSGTKGKKVLAKSSYGSVQLTDSESSEVDVHSSSGDVKLENVHGDRLRVGSSYGAVEMRRIEGELEADLASGDVSLREWSGKRASVATKYGSVTAERTSGALEARSSSGEVQVREHDGSITAHSSYGEVHVEGVFPALEADSSSGDVVVHARTGSRIDSGWKISSSYGSVELVVPDGFGCHLDAKTSYGEVEVGLPIEPDAGAKKKSEHSAKGNLNGGGGSIEIRCKSGDVKVGTSGR
jgi:DUF4097 and DUF4098 domain-containing protein YvlB